MPTHEKLDPYKQHKAEYVAPKAPVLVDIKPAKYLTVTGQGAPASADFQNAIGALYAAAFTIKMAKKFAGQDYKVCHLEGLWWGCQDTPQVWPDSPDDWNWQLLIRVPDFIIGRDLKAAVKQLMERGRGDHADEVKLEKITEGKCVQALHVGPYAEEKRTIGRMMEFAVGQGLAFHGHHHEIYLSDPRRVPPTRLKTILRHPVRRAAKSADA